MQKLSPQAIENRRIRSRKHYAENKEKYLEYKRAERARKGEALAEKNREQNRIWYHEQGGKESTRKRKGYETKEEYLAKCEQRRLKSLERKRLHAASEAGKRTRCARTIYRKFKYLGFNIDLYDQMYDQQNGKCAICHDERPRYGQLRMHIDHCHATRKIRALLCPLCNAGLGHMRDNVDIMLAAIDYVRKYA